MKHLTLKAVNKAIKAKYPAIELIKGDGYFYICSDNNILSLQLSALYTTTIDVHKINHLPIDRWVERVEHLMRDEWRAPLDREPITFYELDQGQQYLNSSK